MWQHLSSFSFGQLHTSVVLALPLLTSLQHAPPASTRTYVHGMHLHTHTHNMSVCMFIYTYIYVRLAVYIYMHTCVHAHNANS